MAYWLGFLILLSGILTYAMFPRNDSYQLETQQEQSSIITFVAQHQTAKDYIYQMGGWQSGTSNPQQIPDELLGRSLPDGMGDDDTVGDNSVYTSAIVCLTLTDGHYSLPSTCSPTDHRFVITYDGGVAPEWWKDKSVNRYTWVKSIAQKTHGSKACGILEREDGAYTIFNGQTRFGYENQNTTLPTALMDALEVDEGWMFCMSRANNPYSGEPLTSWDKLYITRTGGAVADTLLPTGFSGNIYTIAGVVDRTGSSLRTILTGMTENNGTIQIGNTIVEIDPGQPFAFTYTSTGTKEILNVYYSHKEKGTDGSVVDVEWTRKQDIKDSAGPSMPGSLQLGVNAGLAAIRVYSPILTEQQANKNARIDRKRFGL